MAYRISAVCRLVEAGCFSRVKRIQVMSITPFLRVPVTDLTGCLLNHQMVGRCADIEMKVVDCLEAYGRTRGKIKCADLLDDFKECTTRRKQFERILLMRNERHMQYYKNERKEHYAEPPKVDSF